MQDLGDRIGLALSGGGFRATLFHLGVVRLLFEVGQLKFVKLVSAVSGGSILAAHLVLNWEKYTGSKEEFDSAAGDVLDFVQADIRGQVLRRWILGCATVAPRFLLPKKWQWSLVNLLQRQYARLFRVPVVNAQATVATPSTKPAPDSDATKPVGITTYREATIRDLRGARPAVRFNCTSLTTGDAYYFDQAGFGRYKEGFIDPPIPALGLRLAYVIAASSAFPPLFPPVEISYKTLTCDQTDFEHEHRLTDGGVYDNLGIEALLAKYRDGEPAAAQQISLGSIVISDAEGNFDSDFDTRYSFPVNRNVRASDLLMKRVSVFQLADLERNVEGAAKAEIPFVRVKIREEIRDLDDKTVLEPEAQRALINVRTDLDRFTPDEITALIAHGYSKAREALIDKKLLGTDAPKFSWDPLGNWSMVKPLPGGAFQQSRERKWRLWSAGDVASWLSALYALFICVLLVAPTLVLAVQFSNAAKEAAEAAQAAATAKAARAAAQTELISGAISQIQNVVASMSRGCPGGAYGMPPANWGNLQSHGNKAVAALNAAQLAMAKAQPSEALQQINTAKSELDALVDGAQQSCSGGGHGQDPVAYSGYLSTRTTVKGNLDELKRFLGD
ncbi:putative acylesterase/phospholipase RssA/type II secretory pathway pseudopilin PulG [Bradyrhizobium sp. USDA 3240]